MPRTSFCWSWDRRNSACNLHRCAVSHPPRPRPPPHAAAKCFCHQASLIFIFTVWTLLWESRRHTLFLLALYQCPTLKLSTISWASSWESGEEQVDSFPFDWTIYLPGGSVGKKFTFTGWQRGWTEEKYMHINTHTQTYTLTNKYFNKVAWPSRPAKKTLKRKR